MERRSVSEHKEHFQTILRNVENDTKLEVFDAEETAGSKVGDNYLSVVLKTVVNGKRGNGEPYSGIFMTKYLPHHRVFAAAMRNDEVFLNEAHVYNKILPYLGDIGPKCIFADKNEIIMEDLKSQGYIIKPRLDLLDLQHCTALVEKLATLHARSLNLKFKDNKLFNELLSPLSEAIFPLDDKPSMGTSLEISLTTAIKHLESLEQSDAINNGINLLKKFENKTFSIMSNLVKQGQNKYDVITHGDSWINNLLFKNDKNGCIEDVKLIDFQIVRHVSPAIDFHYFVYSSANSHVVNHCYDKLINIYFNKLKSELIKLNFHKEHLNNITIDWFKEELNKNSLYGLFTSFWLVNAILAEGEDILDLDTITAEQMQEMGHWQPPIRPLKAHRINDIVQHYMKHYN